VGALPLCGFSGSRSRFFSPLHSPRTEKTILLAVRLIFCEATFELAVRRRVEFFSSDPSWSSYPLEGGRIFSTFSFSLFEAVYFI